MDKPENQSYTMYARERNGKIDLIWPHPSLCRMAGVKSEEMISVRVTERYDLPLPEDWKAPCHVAWRRKDENRASMHSTCYMMLHVGFPYGIQKAIERGDGIPVVCEVEKIEWVEPPK